MHALETADEQERLRRVRTEDREEICNVEDNRRGERQDERPEKSLTRESAHKRRAAGRGRHEYARNVREDAEPQQHGGEGGEEPIFVDVGARVRQ